MLDKDLNDIATQEMPQIFQEAGTETAVIIRDTIGTNEYGGVEKTEDCGGLEIPCVLDISPTPRQSAGRALNGEEYMDGRIMLPSIWMGEPVEIKRSDRLLILARNGNNPERLFEVRDPRNVYGVYLDIGVVSADSPTEGN